MTYNVQTAAHRARLPNLRRVANLRDFLLALDAEADDLRADVLDWERRLLVNSERQVAALTALEVLIARVRGNKDRCA
jgi:hypothetical protein